MTPSLPLPPELVAMLLGIGFILGCAIYWPLASRRGELKAQRRWDADLDDDGPWWSL